MKNVLKIPRITNTTIKYFVDGEFVGNVNINQVNKIRENVLEYIVNTKDISILNRFYFIGHKDTNTSSMGEEVKITMDHFGHFSDLPWEMSHVRRSTMHLLQIRFRHREFLNSLNND